MEEQLRKLVQNEVLRVSKLLDLYKKLEDEGVGVAASTVMSISIHEAIKAVSENDQNAMQESYECLRAYKAPSSLK